MPKLYRSNNSFISPDFAISSHIFDCPYVNHAHTVVCDKPIAVVPIKSLHIALDARTSGPQPQILWLNGSTLQYGIWDRLMSAQRHARNVWLNSHNSLITSNLNNNCRRRESLSQPLQCALDSDHMEFCCFFHSRHFSRKPWNKPKWKKTHAHTLAHSCCLESSTNITRWLTISSAQNNGCMVPMSKQNYAWIRVKTIALLRAPHTQNYYSYLCDISHFYTLAHTLTNSNEAAVCFRCQTAFFPLFRMCAVRSPQNSRSE